ncbi:hypothetical protein GKC30_00430 [Pseudodesulfovibrio sp. F-1]|uniref:Uncharacterized protein n=1 Tax=Pseudodesulfovibrio alkaliphilus TaxID=2661613 RepID=A0A7K1KJ64_9BACT|nr:hypothetical protein [Pseudodesulfovibrio alkaliphilus]MUM76096.1 hypothetical protein [Pseudodesulfovibrio alkaliphilus]
MAQKSEKFRATARSAPSPVPAADAIALIEGTILRMTASVRREMAGSPAPVAGAAAGADNSEALEVRPLGWWVLVCGEPLNERSLAARDAARDRLLDQVRASGLVLAENIWVWDETGMAQLVISTVPSLKRAERLASHLRGKGLSVRIRREKF